MSRYAEKTTVSSERSRIEIEQTLQRYGATTFAYGWDQSAATILFEMADRRIRFRLPMPDRNSREFTHTPGKNLRRSENAAAEAWEQATRQRWRALALVIKAKLEAVAAEITTVEQEFLAHIVLPDNSTVGEWARPQLATAYQQHSMPALMPGAAVHEGAVP